MDQADLHAAEALVTCLSSCITCAGGDISACVRIETKPVSHENFVEAVPTAAVATRRLVAATDIKAGSASARLIALLPSCSVNRHVSFARSCLVDHHAFSRLSHHFSPRQHHCRMQS
jgi:hypothetical protein